MEKQKKRQQLLVCEVKTSDKRKRKGKKKKCECLYIYKHDTDYIGHIVPDHRFLF